MKKVLFTLLAGVLALGCSENPENPENPNPLPSEVVLTLSESSLKFSAAEGEDTVEAECTGEWQAVLVNAAEWVSFNPRGGASGKTEVTISATANITGTRRTATVEFSSTGQKKRLAISQEAASLEVSSTSLQFPAAGGANHITVTTGIAEWNVEATSGKDWCVVSKEETDKIAIEVGPHSGDRRVAVLTITAGELSKLVSVVQSGGTYQDRDTHNLQRATKGQGVDIVIMGDGYTAADMTEVTGKYETDMRATMEHFFSVYPYNEYREYFNVWMAVGVSNESGLSSKSPRVTIDTAFDCLWNGGKDTYIECNNDKVREYARLATSNKNIDELTVIMTVNSGEYFGTCHYFPSSSVTPGFSISLCPANYKSFKNIVVHEACGHGFGTLEDEYIWSPVDTFISSRAADEVRYWQARGYYANLSLYADIAQSPWKDFADNPKYPMVGMFEGARTYGKGIWRSEQISCMDDNRLYFNAPSRWTQIRRIMKLSGEDSDYTAEEFMAEDVIPAMPASTRAPGEEFIPLARPVMRRL